MEARVIWLCVPENIRASAILCLKVTHLVSGGDNSDKHPDATRAVTPVWLPFIVTEHRKNLRRVAGLASLKHSDLKSNLKKK